MAYHHEGRIRDSVARIIEQRERGLTGPMGLRIEDSFALDQLRIVGAAACQVGSFLDSLYDIVPRAPR